MNKIKEKDKQCKELAAFINSFFNETFFESQKLEDISKYKSFKFIIINDDIYYYMNKSSEKILKSLIKKDYIINSGRLYIKLENNKLKKYEILVAGFLFESSYFIPELLFKYRSNQFLINDFEYLKFNDYKIFKKEHISSDVNELIDIKTKDRIGLIYDLKNSNINYQINENSNKLYNNLKEKYDFKNNKSKISIKENSYKSQKEDLNNNELNNHNKEESLKSSLNTTENSNKEKTHIQVINEKEIQLDEYNKNYVEFLIRLTNFEKKISTKIKYSSKFDVVYEQGYIINNKLIEIYKNWYNKDQLIHLLNYDSSHIAIFIKYKNNYDYIGEAKINIFLKETMNYIPKVYIKERQEKNNSLFKEELKNDKLYTPEIKYHRDYFYFLNCTILNENLVKYLLYNIQGTNLEKKLKEHKITFKIIQYKMFIKYNLHIYIGNIDDKNIFHTEIIIIGTDEKETISIFNELNTKTIEDFINLTKRIDENVHDIGKYNNTNNLVIIINDNYLIPKRDIPKNETISSTRENFGIQGNTSAQKINKDSNNNNSILPNNINSSMNFNNNSNEVSLKKSAQKLDEDNQQKEKTGSNKGPRIEKYTLNKEIENLLNIIIDMKKIKGGINSQLNEKSELKHYFSLNYDWLKNYLEVTNLNKIYNNEYINNSVNQMINSKNKISNLEIILNIKYQHEFMKIIDNNPINSLTNNNLLKKFSITPNKIKINDFFYYSNFILISEDTMKSLITKIDESQYFNCYIGDNRIFYIYNDKVSKFLIEVYNLVNNNIVPEIIYQFYKKNELLSSLDILLKQGYIKFTDYYLMFNKEDQTYVSYASPIFNIDNKEIGYAYRYNQKISDYSDHIINNEYKSILKFYFYNIYLKYKSKTEEDGKYYLINEEYMKKYKEYYEYSNLEKIFANNQIFHQVVNSLKDNRYSFNEIINDKKLTLIIQNSSFEKYNKMFNEKSKKGFHTIKNKKGFKF